MHLLILNGPNLNLLGQREPSIYGHTSLSSLEESLTQLAQKEGITLSFFQSNSEGDLITAIQEAAFKGIDGIVFNAGAYTHYSYAILDAIKAVPTPVIEVHLSNIHQRESFRQQSVLAPACLGQIAGFGADSYRLGILAMIRHLQLVQPSV